MFELRVKNREIMRFLIIVHVYINPIEPAVNPTIKKNVNSSRSLGREFTNRFI